MLLIIGTVRLPEEKLEAARPAMAAIIAASSEEPGCLEYTYAVDVIDRGLIHVKERWTDREALHTHFRSDHVAQWRAQWPALGIGERKLFLYEAGEPQLI